LSQNRPGTFLIFPGFRASVVAVSIAAAWVSEEQFALSFAMGRLTPGTNLQALYLEAVLSPIDVLAFL
jgi:hypothetical protein